MKVVEIPKIFLFGCTLYNNKLNENWLDPIKGSQVPLYTLKRKNIRVEEYSAKKFMVQVDDEIPISSKDPKQRSISAFLNRT